MSNINVELTREEYKHIKGLNRQELQAYISNIYISGHNNGVEAFRSKISRVIDKGVRNAKGIGEKRYADIMNSINNEIDKEVESETNRGGKFV